MNQIIGSLMMAALFVGMFALVWVASNFKRAASIFICAGILLLWILIALKLIVS